MLLVYKLLSEIVAVFCPYSNMTYCKCILISLLVLRRESHKQLVCLGLNTWTAGSTGIIVLDRSEVEVCMLYLYVLGFLKGILLKQQIDLCQKSVSVTIRNNFHSKTLKNLRKNSK